MKRREEIVEEVLKAFRKKKILTIEEIRDITAWSPMSLWRNLKPVGYYTSFNYNARYYTLAQTPRFDENGLWFYRTVGFSSYGGLNRTLVALVETSSMGMTPGELSEILTVRVQNQVSQLYGKKEIERVKWGRAQLYLSRDKEVLAEQLRRREAQREEVLPVTRAEPSVTEEETIEILAELVRKPRSSARRIAIVLSARGLQITREKVFTVIEQHGLQKKKGSQRSRR